MGFTSLSLTNGLKPSSFTLFSLKNGEQKKLLLCVRSKMVKNKWFYYKTNPSNRQQPTGPPIRGLALQYAPLAGPYD